MNNILKQPYTTEEYAQFAVEANQNGQIIEVLDDSVYALFPYEKVENEEIVDMRDDSAYKEQAASEQAAKFNADFMETSFGYLRKQPKGFSNLMESFNTAMIGCTGIGFVPAGALTIYSKPEFNGEQTQVEIEQWLVDNTVKNAQLSPQEFTPMYLEVTQKWVAMEHS